MPINAIRGLLDFITTLVTKYEPSHLVCCWDNDWRPAWRVALVPSYKAHRVAGSGDAIVKEMSSSGNTAGETAPADLAVQVPYIQEALRCLGIAVVGKNGYEADDVIGTLAATSPMPVDVVTGDRDLFQVVDDERSVRVLYIARGVGRHEIVDDAWMVAKYGIHAAAYVDYATMRGDASDGLPGVAGIGEKTAASLVNSYGNLEGILAAASEPKSKISGAIRSKLSAGIDYLAVAPQVVSVATDLKLGVDWDHLALPAKPKHPQRFAELAELLGLSSSAERVTKALSLAGSRPADA